MVTLDDDVKDRFDALQQEGTTQSEFVDVLLDHYELTDDDGVAQVREIIDRLDDLEKVVGAKTELAARRGAQQAIDERLQK